MFKWFVFFMIPMFIIFSAMGAEVPLEWKEAAITEPQLKVHSGWDEREVWPGIQKAFNAKYPYIRISYEKTNSKRTSRDLIVFQTTGDYKVHVYTGATNYLSLMSSKGMLENLNDLPSIKDVIPSSIGNNGDWVSYGATLFCLAYNTKLVKQEQLPNTFEELPKNEFLKNGNMAIGIQSNFLIPLLEIWSNEQVEKYVNSVFAMKPFKAKGSYSLRINLLGAGEFSTVFPLALHQIEKYSQKGLSIAPHCFDIIPSAVSPIAVLKDNPAKYSSKIFVNWILSKEGQNAIWKFDRRTPIRQDMQGPAYFPMLGETKNKRIIFRAWGADETADRKFLNKIWNLDK